MAKDAPRQLATFGTAPDRSAGVSPSTNKNRSSDRNAVTSRRAHRGERPRQHASTKLVTSPAGQAGDSACAGRYDKKEPRDATSPPPDKERSTFRHGRSRRIPGRTGQPPMPPRQQQPDTTAETRHNTISNQARADPESSRQTGRSAGAVHRSVPHPRRIAAHLRITSGDADPDSG